MARALILLAGAMGAAGCFHATPYSPAAAQEQWRALRDAAAERAPKAEPGPTGAAVVLGPEETYALALANSADVAALEAEADAEAANVLAAKQLENPQLRLTGFNLDDALTGDPTLNIGLRVPIPRPGTVRARVAGAEVAAQGQRSESDDAKRLLREQVYKLHARLAMAQADREHAARVVALRDERRRALTARAEQAVATRLDLAMADVLHAEALHAQAEVEADVAELEAALTRLTGLRGPLRFRADPGQLQVADVALDREALTLRALAARPELHAAHAAKVEAEAEAHLAKSEAWPWFEWAQLQYRATPGSPPTAFGFGVAIALPVLSWNRGAIKASKALVRQRQLEERARIVAVAAEVDEAVVAVERTAARVLELERDVLPVVEAAAREAQDALSTGALDPMIANDVDVRAVEARRTHLAALLEHREAVIELEAVVGGPLEGPAPRAAR